MKVRDGQAPILVTGALGFVGRHLVASLLADGRSVVGLGRHTDDDPPPDRCGEFIREGAGPIRYAGECGSFDYVPCALEDAAAVTGVLSEWRPAEVFHLAAQSSAALSFAEPADTFASNVIGTLNLLEAVRRLPEERRPSLLSVGSAEEYGPQPDDAQPLPEDTALNPISPYAVSKAAQTHLCRQYAHSYGLRVTATRSFNHTGPGQAPRFAFPSFARQIAAAEAGNGPREIATGDLSAVRDFLDVRDVVAAYRLLSAHGSPGGVYNVCSGTSLTMAEGLEILVGAAACPITVRQDPARCRPADTPRLVGDNTRLRQDTGWAPERDVADTLRELLDEARKETT